MNFFRDIGRGFQDLGNTINNEVIKPINNEVIKPIESEVAKIQDVPKQIENLPNKIETQINNELKKIHPKLRLPPPPKVITTKNINLEIKKELENTIIKPFEKEVINPSQKIFENEIIKPSQKISTDIQTGFQKDIIDGFQTKIIDGFKNDIINPTNNAFDNIGDAIEKLNQSIDNLNQSGSKAPTNSNISDYDLLIFSGIGLLVVYIVLK